MLHKGEAGAGTILVVLTQKGANARLFERMPGLDGDRPWTLTRAENIENNKEMQDYLDRRVNQDPDLWIVELDIANGERFIGLTPPAA